MGWAGQRKHNSANAHTITSTDVEHNISKFENAQSREKLPGARDETACMRRAHGPKIAPSPGAHPGYAVGRHTRIKLDVPCENSSDSDDEDHVSLDAACPAPVPQAPLPDGYVERTHVTPSGRTYRTYVDAEGRVARSRAEAWRHFTAAHAEQHDPSGICVPTDDDDVEGSYAPFIAFDVSTPVAPGASPQGRHERLSDMARRLRSARDSPAPEPSRPLPFGASVVEVAFDCEQCGNPRCLAKSRNGLHAGDCRFPEPPPRR